MRALVLALLALGGCRSSAEEVDVTIDFDSSVEFDRLRRLVVDTSGSEYETYALSATPSLLDRRQARFVYRPGVSSGSLQFYVLADDGTGTDGNLGTGLSGPITLGSGRVAAQLTLFAKGPPPPADLAGSQEDLGDLGGVGLDLGDLAVPPDGAGDASTSTCVAKGVLFCDDFEGVGVVDPAKWPNVVSTGGTVTIDPIGAKGTSHSLRLHVNANAGSSVNVGVGEGQTTYSAPRYLRFYLKAQNLPSVTNGVNLLTVLNESTTQGVQFQTDSSTTNISVSSYGVTPPISQFSTVSVPTAFTCFEWLLDNGGSNGTRTWMNDVEITSLHSAAFNVTAGFGTTILSVTSLPAGNPAFDLWFDEVLIDSKPIGCAK